MHSVRPAAVAGMFYPAAPEELRRQVTGYLSAAGPSSDPPKALIAPHAGYAYSGAVAACAYALLRAHSNLYERVVLVGPSHRLAFEGIAVPTADAFATPLGPVPVDRATVRRLLERPYVHLLDAAHKQEHSLEVHLPFLQEVLRAFQIVPFVVGDTTAEIVADTLEHVWGGPETLVIASSDLSHDHDYETARHKDAATSRAIENLEPDAIGLDDACGRVPIGGLLLQARQRGLHGKLLELRNSGDTAGGKDHVVGYGAYGFD